MPDPPVTAAQTDQPRAREIVEQVAASCQCLENYRHPGGPSDETVELLTSAFADVRAEQATTDTARREQLEQDNAALRELVRRTAELSRLIIDADAEWQLITDCRAQIAGASHATSR